MRIIHGIRSIGRFRRPVVALGVFDGVHAGHRAIISFCVKHARAVGGTSVVVTFWPHPGRQEHLYSLSHRLRLIAELGVDVCVVIRFTASFRKRSPGAFIREFLAGRLGAYLVCVGENFRFGYRAQGTADELLRQSRALGFQARVFRVKRVRGVRVSSTLIRSCIRAGNLARASRLLGRPVSIFGTVVHGRGYGTRLGFPTANIHPHHEIVPAAGVYAVRVMLKEKMMRGVCYIGPVPHFLRRASDASRAAAGAVEVHIFNFHRMLYGRDIEVQFLKRIRPRLEFSEPGALRTRIRQDIQTAHAWFARHKALLNPSSF